MYRNVIGCNGCLVFFIVAFIFLFLFKFLLKFWFVIFLAILAFMYLNEIKKFFNIKKENKSDYTSEPGKVYKQCDYCNAKADRNAAGCPNCGKLFE